MILIADSGSTKTDWRLIDKGQQVKQVTSLGFNPMLQEASAITQEIRNVLMPAITPLIAEDHKLEIFYYGAGCSTEKTCAIIHSALIALFPGSVIEVDHDLLAAARSVCGREKGIAAILGTGSNSCVYDGSRITSNVPSLGFILGDEGSGAFIGKHFIIDYLNGDLPEKISAEFQSMYSLEKEQILEGIYKQPMPSRFLASFSKFIFLNKENPYFQRLIRYCFEQFFIKHICKYPEHKSYPMSCVGSIAFYYKDILSEVAAEKGVKLNKVLDSPMEGLISYHSETRSILS